jgi:hypothetical protein
MPARSRRSFVLSSAHHAEPVAESFTDEARVVHYERAMRVHRAHSETFAITALEGELEGAFAVRGSTAQDHVVDLVDRTREHDTCSCPDFLANLLGTCKHLEAIRRAERELAVVRRAVASLPRKADVATLTVHADGRVRLAAAGPRSSGAPGSNAIRAASSASRRTTALRFAPDGRPRAASRMPPSPRRGSSEHAPLAHKTCGVR